MQRLELEKKIGQLHAEIQNLDEKILPNVALNRRDLLAEGLSPELGILGVSRFETLYRTPCNGELMGADLHTIGNRQVIEKCLERIKLALGAKPQFCCVSASFKPFKN